jgi:hypothetical protein
VAISLNVLGLPVPDVPALVAWCVVARPPYALVMDNLDIAGRIRMASPDTQIVCRKYRPDDHKLHETTSPAEFLNSVSDVPQSYIVQAGNEPGGDMRALAAWTAELIAKANVLGRRLAVCSFSVGNPDEDQIAAGWYDPILRGLAGSRHVLSLHEYLHDKPAQEPWFIGRFAHFLQRADQLGISRPVVVITEHGRDLGGGPDDGWRGQGWSEADYARRLDEAQTVYAPDGITACVFSYGAGFDQRWQSFNVEGAPDLLRAMEAMNVGREDDDVGLPGWAQAKTKTAGASVNVRNAPAITAPVVSTVKTDDWTKKIGAPIRNGQYTWQQVILNEPNKCVHGYVALEVITV